MTGCAKLAAVALAVLAIIAGAACLEIFIFAPARKGDAIVAEVMAARAQYRHQLIQEFLRAREGR